MKLEKPLLKNLLFALVLLCISSCNNNTKNIPFPENETDFPQPVSKPLKFSDVIKLKLTNDVSPLKPVIKKFDFDKLPVKVYDSSGFLPFAKKPDSVKFDYDKLPDTVFDYNKLPSTPLKFETSVLDLPEVIQAGSPRLIKGATNLMYELGESQGLVGNFISCIFEDKSGFLWIATDKSLYRYDGEYLVLYIHMKAGYLIFSILEDTREQIWMATVDSHGGREASIDIIDPKEGIVKHLNTSKAFGDGGILNMLLDDKGRIWTTAGSGGVSIIDENSGLIKQFNRAQGLSDNWSVGIIQDNKSNIWISTAHGLNILDVKNEKIKYLNKSTGLSTDTVTTILQDKIGTVWLAGLSGKLNLVDMKTGIIMRYDNVFSKNNRYNVSFSLLNDIRGNVWIGDYQGAGGSSNGTVIIDPVNELIKTLKTSDSLLPYSLQRILQDKREQIWIATYTGLNMVNKNGNDLQHIGETDITSLTEDSRGKIWIGNQGAGIDILDPLTGLSRSFTMAQGLSGRMYNMITEEGKIFIATDRGLDIIDSSRKTIKHFGKLQGLSTDTIGGMLKDNKGMLWVGGYSDVGVDILDLQKNTIHHIGTAQGLNDASIINITQDNQGRVWFTNHLSGGIIDTKTNTIKHLNNLPGLTDLDYTKPLLEDKQGNMWIGTDKGIDIINEKTDSFISFSIREGLLDNFVLSLNKYNDQIYVGTSGGISILTPPNTKQKTWKIESYGKTQGISKLATTGISDIITKNGKFLWGDRGLTILNSINMIVVPKTYITGIDVFNRPQYFTNNPWPYLREKDTLWSSTKDSFYLNGNLPASNKMKWDSVTTPYNMPVNLRLAYDENYLQFYFSQLNSGSVDSTWYRYTLEGIDKSWSDKTVKTYSENYVNLPPSNYKFMVCSEGSNDLWSKPAELQFTILPPWWQTWWFYFSEAITAIAIVYWIVRLYTAKKLAKQKIEYEKLRAVSMERERIASDMHDDLGAGLTSIRLLSEVANLKAGKDNIAKSEIEKIVKSTDHLSENLREIIWTMNTRFNKLEDFIIYIRTYAVEFFDNSSIKFQFNKPTIIPEVKMSSELRRNLLLCIKEALNNIVKHSRATEAELSFDVKGNVLFTQIKDNGKGIDTNQINKFGNGLNSMKERLNKYGSDLKIEVNNGTSLRFEIDTQK